MGLLIRRPSLSLAAVLFVTALGLALAFPRTDWEGTVWLALTPLLVAAVRRPVRDGFAWGWFFGTVFFLVLLRWLDFT